MANRYEGRLGDMEQPLARSEEEFEIISEVAREYGLNPEQTKLLFSIRKAEKGGPGREFGIMKKKAQRFKNDPKASLRLQAMWSAGTIRNRYRGNVEEFAYGYPASETHEKYGGYAPIGVENDPENLNANWAPNVNKFMGKDYVIK